MKSAISATVD